MDENDAGPPPSVGHAVLDTEHAAVHAKLAKLAALSADGDGAAVRAALRDARDEFRAHATHEEEMMADAGFGGDVADALSAAASHRTSNRRNSTRASARASARTSANESSPRAVPKRHGPSGFAAARARKRAKARKRREKRRSRATIQHYWDAPSRTMMLGSWGKYVARAPRRD